MTQNPNDWQRPPQDQWGPRQPQPPQWQQQPQYPPQPYPPQYGPRRRKSNAGKIIAIGCLGMVLIVVLIVVVAVLLASGHPNPATGA